MPRYSRAYEVERIRAYEGWQEPADADVAPIVYLDDKLRVRNEPFVEGRVIFSEDSTAWRSFCATSLDFRVPDWSAEGAEVRRLLDISEVTADPRRDDE